MSEFIFFMIGAFLDILITALFQANRNNADRERAEHAIKQAERYKEFIKNNNIGGFKK